MFNGEADQRAGVCRRRQLRRLPAPDQGGVRRPDAVAAGAPDLGQLGQHRPPAAADGLLLPRRRAGSCRAAAAAGVIVSTPSGNFGNLTAGLMAKRAGLPIARFVAATNVNDVVPAYLATGRFEPRPSVQTHRQRDGRRQPEQLRAHAVAVRRRLDAMRRDVIGQPSRRCRGASDDSRGCTSERGYLLDPHSAIAYLGLKARVRALRRSEPRACFWRPRIPRSSPRSSSPIIGRADPEAAAARRGAVAAADRATSWNVDARRARTPSTGDSAARESLTADD